MKPRCFRLTMDSNIEDAVMASTMVRGLLEQLRVAGRDTNMVELCLTEALVNAVRHAYGGKSGFEVFLDLEMEAGAIAMEIITAGTRTTRAALEAVAAKAARVDSTSLDNLPEDGRGMLIISRGMDQWDYFQRGELNVLRMRKTLTSATPGSGSPAKH
ncbi:MAG: ATP-binding protein [Bryobacterales bacterium]|nr:ATP-binding protein [Bryobacterales bacterium]